MPRITILGIPVDCITQREALRRIEGFLRSEGKFHVTTPNPEMLVETRKNREFRKVLQNTALNLPDGIGLIWAMNRACPPKRDLPAVARSAEAGARRRVTGTDTMITLCSTTTERVFLLGAADGIAERAAERLKEHNPALNVVGTFAGSPRPDDERHIADRINAASPTLLFVAYGAPAQDLWIARNLKKMPSVKVAMGVGGAFDFIAGKQKRAPAPLRTLGLEWLWRLIKEPARFGRIWRAVVVFPWMVMTNDVAHTQSLTSPSPQPAAP